MQVEFIERGQPVGIMRWVPAALLLLAVAAWIAVAWQHHERVRLDQATREAREQGAWQRQSAAHETSMPLTFNDAEGLRKAWQLGRFNTQGALTALESVPTGGVKIRALDLDGDAGHVTVEFEAHDANTMAQYLDALNAGYSVKRWALLKVAKGAVLPGSEAPPPLNVVMSSDWP